MVCLLLAQLFAPCGANVYNHMHWCPCILVYDVDAIREWQILAKLLHNPLNVTIQWYVPCGWALPKCSQYVNYEQACRSVCSTEKHGMAFPVLS